MQIVVFIFYLLTVSFVIPLIPFFKKCGINKWALIALFVIKVFAGVAYGVFYTLPKYNAGSDTWRFYRLSLAETKWLLTSPSSFIKDLFYYGYTTSGNIFRGENSYWNDLKTNFPVKIMAILNLLSGSRYYVNVIFFNFLFLIGLVALSKVLFALYPGKKLYILFGVFLLPSTLFWCSGMHKDGLILSAIGVATYCLWRLANHHRLFRYYILILLSFFVIFCLKNYILFALLPAIMSWLLSEKFSNKKLIIFSSVYIIVLIAFFLLPSFFPALDLPLFLSQKRQEFLQLDAGSQVSGSTLSPTPLGFISFLPEAIDMAFFRPHITELKNFFYLPAIIENLFLIILIVSCILRRQRQISFPPTVLYLFAFAITVLVICGYTIPFTGAIVRYRSLVLPLLVTPLLCATDTSYYTKKSKFLKD